MQVLDKNKNRIGIIIEEQNGWIRCQFNSHPEFVSLPQKSLDSTLSSIVFYDPPKEFSEPLDSN